ncbi:MAG: cobalamin biosynthesis protein [Desulfosoma sp.]
MVFVPPDPDLPHPIAVISVTRQGTALALRLTAALPNCSAYVPARHAFAVAMGGKPYDRLRDLFARLWLENRALVCIMAAGIVVRCIAPLIRSKTRDPAVVVVDERGSYAVSLLSGHLGGANRLAQIVADLLGGRAVITTGSDVSRKPAVDTMAASAGLVMEDMTWAARVTTAVLDDEPFWVYDPDGHLANYRESLPSALWIADVVPHPDEHPLEALEGGLWDAAARAAGMDLRKVPGLWVSERIKPDPYPAVVLRPRCLTVGIGCNRKTPAWEIVQAVRDVFYRNRLAPNSIRTVASVDVKEDEAGLREAARRLEVPIVFFSRKSLQGQRVPNPSPMVHRHIGVSSVCEAAALMAAWNGRLIVEKQKTPNVTVAVAKDGSGS